MSNSLTKYATAGEQEIALKLIRALLRSCYHLSVNDGEETTLYRSYNERSIIDALATTDIDIITVHGPLVGDRLGSFLLIYGNAPDGSELIADHTDNALCSRIAALVYGEVQ
jgi:hypothetical protein